MTRRLIQILLFRGGIEQNPGPAYPCTACSGNVGCNSIQCNGCGKWTHQRCSGMTKRELAKVISEAGINGHGWICNQCRNGRERSQRTNGRNTPEKQNTENETPKTPSNDNTQRRQRQRPRGSNSVATTAVQPAIAMAELEDRNGNRSVRTNHKCGECNRILKSIYKPITCNGCATNFHKVCTGMTRSGYYAVALEQEANESRWLCRRCDPLQTAGDQAADDTQEKPQEEWKDSNCDTCKKPIRKAKFMPECSRCRRRFHQSEECSGLTRQQLVAFSNARWVCNPCQAEIRDSLTQPQQHQSPIQLKEKTKTARSKLKILQWNADGISTKQYELEEVLRNNEIDIAMIQETKLVTGKNFHGILGYTAIRQDRTVTRIDEVRKGGGLTTLVRSNLKFRKGKPWTGSTIEGQNVIVHLNPTTSITCTNVYRPPLRNTANEQRRNEYLPALLKASTNHIIAGDVNLHSSVWCRSGRTDAESEDLEEWCLSKNYIIMNDGSETHTNRGTGRGSSPDITMAHESIARNLQWKTINEMSSDHYPIIITLDCDRYRDKEEEPIRWCWQKANWNKYADAVTKGIEEQTEPANLADRVKWFADILQAAAKVAVPKKKVKAKYKPFWNEKLKDLARKRNDLRQQLPGKRKEWQEMCELMKKEVLEARKQYWRNFVETLDEKVDTRRVWNTIRKLNGTKKAQKENESIIHKNVERKTDEQKADAFIQEYAKVAKLELSKEERNTKTSNAKILRDYEGEMEMSNSPFTSEEFDFAMRQLKAGKKGGSDNIEMPMLKRMPEKGRLKLLEIFNESWSSGTVPGKWKQAIVIPIQKKGKDPRALDSYRPISLTSTCVKLLERMVANRMNYWMEKNEIINKWQAGFQRGRSTEEQIIRLSQSIHDGFLQKPPHKTLAAMLDCSKAYDRVWKERLIQKLILLKMPQRMLHWVKNFLEDRKAMVKLGSATSKWRRFHQGLPQGAVLSPILFLLYANDIREYTTAKVEYSGYADDMAVHATGRDKETIKEDMQEALDNVRKWAEENKIRMNANKSASILFSNNSKDRSWIADLKLGQDVIPTTKEVTFLGITFDSGLTFNSHTKNTTKKMKSRTTALQAIAGNTWGSERTTLKKVWQMTGETPMWYGAGGWMPWISKTNFNKLEIEQKKAGRIISGLTKTCNETAIWMESELEPASSKGTTISINAMEKVSRMESTNPLNQIADRQIRNRFKKEKGWREQTKKACEQILGKIKRRKFEKTREPPWATRLNATINTKLCLESSKQDDKDTLRRVTKQTILSLGEFDATIYSDGSVAGGVTDGGGAAIVRTKDGVQQTLRVAAGTICSSYTAEMKALGAAADWIKRKDIQSCLILTDSQASLTALGNYNNSCEGVVKDTHQKLRALNNRRIVLQWIPAHCGTEGNEQADAEANIARGLPQADIPIEWEAAKKCIKRTRKFKLNLEGRMKTVYGKGIKRSLDSDRKEETLAAQLRSGHCSKTKYFRRRFEIDGNDGKCDKCGTDEGKDHIWECDAEANDRRLFFGREVGVEVLAQDERSALEYLRSARPDWF